MLQLALGPIHEMFIVGNSFSGTSAPVVVFGGIACEIRSFPFWTIVMATQAEGFVARADALPTRSEASFLEECPGCKGLDFAYEGRSLVFGGVARDLRGPRLSPFGRLAWLKGRGLCRTSCSRGPRRPRGWTILMAQQGLKASSMGARLCPRGLRRRLWMRRSRSRGPRLSPSGRSLWPQWPTALSQVPRFCQ